jgi:hypothetical protein
MSTPTDSIATDYYTNQILDVLLINSISSDQLKALKSVVRDIASAEYELGYEHGSNDSASASPVYLEDL